MVGESAITIYARKFSTYAIGYTETVTPPMPSVPTTGGGSVSYTITGADTANGALTISHRIASAGTAVTITATPDAGYTLEKLTVTGKNGKEITLTEKDGKHAFTMPAFSVTVAATFAAVIHNPFADVQESDYFYDAVLWAAANNVTNGTGDALFRPGEVCTRAETVTFLWRAAGAPAPESAENPFVDVKKGAYYYDAVLWAVEKGITNGTGDGTTFSPDARCTRGMTMTFLWRAEGHPAAGVENPFADVPGNTYYSDAVSWAAESGVTEGTGANRFSPDAGCNRAQIVIFLYRNAMK